MTRYLFFLAYRLLRAKQRHLLASTASWVSAVGLTLGLAVLITVSSVMNGLDSEVRLQLLNHVEQILVQQPLHTIEADINRLTNNPAIDSFSPFVRGQALIVAQDDYRPIEIYGIEPTLELAANPALINSVFLGSVADLEPGSYGVVVNELLAHQLNVRLGDRLTLILPTLSHSILGVEPLMKRLTIIGFVSYNQHFPQDQRRIYLNYRDVQSLFSDQQLTSGYRVASFLPNYDYQLMDQLSGDFPKAEISHWSERYSPFFKMLQTQKSVFMLVVFLLVLMAIFYSTSSLVVIVSEKKTEIALLRSLGMQARDVMVLFLIQGLLLSLFGVLFGTVSGLLLSSYLTVISTTLEQWLGIEFINKAAFMIDHIPSQIVWSDISFILCVTVVLILLSAVYPAWCASKIEPAGLLAHD